MAEKDLVVKEKVEGNGIFDFPAFYSFAHGWLRYEEYIVIEDEYSEKYSGNTRDVVFKWTALKQLSDYFKVEIKLKFEVRELTDVEVEIDGKKKKTNKGKVTVEMKGTLVKDPESHWEGTPWYKFLRETYDKYIIPKRVDDMKDKVAGDIRSYKEELKSALDLSGRR